MNSFEVRGAGSVALRAWRLWTRAPRATPLLTRAPVSSSDSTDKSAAVLRALDAGELVIVYDSESESCNILPPDTADEVAAHQKSLEDEP